MTARTGAMRALLALSVAILCGAAPALAVGRAKPRVVRVTAAQATKVALARWHGHAAGKTRLENEEGAWQYSVMVRSGKKLREVMVDAKTGHIASVEVTSGAKERAEARADRAAARKGHRHAHSKKHTGNAKRAR